MIQLIYFFLVFLVCVSTRPAVGALFCLAFFFWGSSGCVSGT